MASTSMEPTDAHGNADSQPDAVKWIQVVLHQDARGTLAAFERGLIPFTPVRAFVISDVPPEAVRAGRALASEEFIWAAVGSCQVTTTSNGIRHSVTLRDRGQGIYLPAGIVVELADFEPGTVLLVLASKPYLATDI
jgi:hypothetical protein